MRFISELMKKNYSLGNRRTVTEMGDALADNGAELKSIRRGALAAEERLDGQAEEIEKLGRDLEELRKEKVWIDDLKIAVQFLFERLAIHDITYPEDVDDYITWKEADGNGDTP